MTTQPSTEETLYDRLGGRTAVLAAVDLFYNKLLDDARVSHFFETIDMEL